MTSIITDSADFDSEDSQSQNLTFNQVSLEWIDNLSPELLKTVVCRFCKIVESKPTLCESFVLNQTLYRTITGNTFTESASSVAQRTGCDRKTIIKGLNQAVEQNILSENLRPGTSNEYFFKPVEEWKPEPLRVRQSPTAGNPPAVLDSPVVHKKDTPKVIQFPSTENIETPVETEPVQNLDNPNLDPNNVVVNKLINKQQQVVSIPITDTPSIWRSLPDGNRYAQIPPIYDQETGVEIQRQMESEGLTAQKVVGRAIAFSKIPLLVLEVLASVGSRLLNACSQTVSKLTAREARASEVSAPQTSPQNQPSNEDVEVVVSIQLSLTLTAMGVVLTNEQMRHCLTEYGEDAMLNAAVQLRKTEEIVTQEDKEGYFLNYLQNAVRGVAVEVVTKKPSMTAIKSVATVEAAPFPTEIMLLLKNADIHLIPAKAEKLWAAHSTEFAEAIAYVDQKAKEGKVTNREGYFVKCLEEGWLVKKTEPEKRDPNTLTLEQQQWYDWACRTGICINTPVKHLPTLMGSLAVPIPIKDRRPFDPPYDLVALDVAMREYPISDQEV